MRKRRRWEAEGEVRKAEEENANLSFISILVLLMHAKKNSHIKGSMHKQW